MELTEWRPCGSASQLRTVHQKFMAQVWGKGMVLQKQIRVGSPLGELMCAGHQKPQMSMPMRTCVLLRIVNKALGLYGMSVS